MLWQFTQKLLTYGPNAFNGIRAAEIVSDIVESAHLSKYKEIERQAFTYFREGPWLIPDDVQTNLVILADRLKPASHPEVGERILIVFLEIVCWSGFTLAEPDREDGFIQLQKDVCKALGINFNHFAWTDPQQRAWKS